jgi:hypothetical protein
MNKGPRVLGSKESSERPYKRISNIEQGISNYEGK